MYRIKTLVVITICALQPMFAAPAANIDHSEPEAQVYMGSQDSFPTSTTGRGHRVSKPLTPDAHSPDITQDQRPKTSPCKSKSLALPISWLNRDDVFNHAADFRSLLAKAKLSGQLPIKNNTKSPISVHIRGEHLAAKKLESVELDLTVGPEQTLNVLNLACYETVSLNEGSQGFLNLYSTRNRHKVSVDPEPVLTFPRPLNQFQFVPQRREGEPLAGDAQTQNKIEQYWGHVGYMKYVVCRDEQIDHKDLFEQRKRVYEKFKLEAMVQTPLPFIPRIPLNLFSIWLTNPDKPIEPDQELIDLALRSSTNNPPKDGWNHYFLVQDPTLFPKTAKLLANTPVKLVALSELGHLELEEELAEAIKANKFAMGSDILRVEVLAKMGGGYLDIDLAVLQSLKPYFHLYHFLGAIEPMSEFVGNAFMAAAVNHPVMLEMRRLIKRNFALSREENKRFYSSAATGGFSTIVKTGPCVASVAFYNAACQKGNIDILMPSEAFYPQKSQFRPGFAIPNGEDAIGLASATHHLWLTTWAGARGARNACAG